MSIPEPTSSHPELIKLKIQVLEVIKTVKQGMAGGNSCPQQYRPRQKISSIITAGDLPSSKTLPKAASIVEADIQYRGDQRGSWYYLDNIKVIPEKGESK